MSLSAGSNKAILEGDGSTTAFSYIFDINTSDGSDLQVYIVDATDSDDIVVTQITTNFSVDVANARINYPTVAGVTPLASGITALPQNWYIVIARIEPLSQTLSIVEQGSISLAAIEGAFDKLTMICQQLQEQINRCVKYPINETTVDSTDVDAFIAAISAIVDPPTLVGTYGNLKGTVGLDPTVRRWGVATDIGGAGGTLMWYSGDTSVGDDGWFTLAGT